jgi:hypothetical protein
LFTNVLLVKKQKLQATDIHMDLVGTTTKFTSGPSREPLNLEKKNPVSCEAGFFFGS